MSLKLDRARNWLHTHQRRPKREFPMATLALYGPDDQHATKLVAAVIADSDEPASVLHRWTSDIDDIRNDDRTTIELVERLKASGIQRVVAADRILGCPHEEGKDYPVGGLCADCPFWADRDRWTGERIEMGDPGSADIESADIESADIESADLDDPDDVTVTYSAHCQIVERDGVRLDVQIFSVEDDQWLLEVVNEQNTSIVWDGCFDKDVDAWAEFQRTLHEEGLAVFE